MLAYITFAFPIKLLGVWGGVFGFFLSIQEFSSLYQSSSLPDLTGRGVSKWLHGAWMLAGVKLQQFFLAPNVGHKVFQIMADLIEMC